VTGDWAAVATAVNQRMAERGLSQREVIKRSDLSKATVREIQKNIKPRHRKARTLEALSVALEWNAGHLAAVLEGRIPPKASEPFAKSADDIPGRLDIIEYRLNEIIGLLKESNPAEDRHAEIVEIIEEAVERTVVRLRNPER
jgi:transcriptional regulator with XRE-family HTH domain